VEHENGRPSRVHVKPVAFWKNEVLQDGKVVCLTPQGHQEHPNAEVTGKKRAKSSLTKLSTSSKSDASSFSEPEIPRSKRSRRVSAKPTSVQSQTEGQRGSTSDSIETLEESRPSQSQTSNPFRAPDSGYTSQLSPKQLFISHKKKSVSGKSKSAKILTSPTSTAEQSRRGRSVSQPDEHGSK